MYAIYDLSWHVHFVSASFHVDTYSGLLASSLSNLFRTQCLHLSSCHCSTVSFSLHYILLLLLLFMPVKIAAVIQESWPFFLPDFKIFSSM